MAVISTALEVGCPAIDTARIPTFAPLRRRPAPRTALSALHPTPQLPRRAQWRSEAGPRHRAAAAADDDPPSPSPALPSLDSLDAEIFNIAVPTLVTLAADPLAALVSVAWVGHLGAAELAGVGVALSVYGAFTKLFNVPLLAVITSATASALGRGDGAGSRRLGAAVTAALALAAGVGLLQAALLGSVGVSGLAAWGAGPATALHAPAAHYLSVRALGAPATVLFLALQGAFRGLGDTRYPLYATVVANAVNVGLEPLFIFTFGWGVRGAAAAVVASQLIAVAGLGWALGRRLDLGRPEPGALGEAWAYLKPTGLLTLRSLAITATFSVATGLAARTDAAHAAAHQIAFQLWLSSSLLADALAVAAQALVARSLAAGTAAGRAVAAAVGRRVVTLSLGLGVALAGGLTAGATLFPLARLFSSDPAVLAALEGLMPAVVALQPLNALAFTMDGLLYGVNGFGYAAAAMAAAAGPAVGLMAAGAAAAGGDPVKLLAAVWAGLGAVMVGRFVGIWVPYARRAPPFDVLAAGEGEGR